jgi:hypothetical protein
MINRRKASGDRGREALRAARSASKGRISGASRKLTESALQDGLNRSRRRDPVGVPVDDAPANGFSSEDRRHAKVEVVALIRTSELLALIVLDLHRVCEVCGDDPLTRSNESDVASRRVADAS